MLYLLGILGNFSTNRLVIPTFLYICWEILCLFSFSFLFQAPPPPKKKENRKMAKILYFLYIGRLLWKKPFVNSLLINELRSEGRLLISKIVECLLSYL